MRDAYRRAVFAAIVCMFAGLLSQMLPGGLGRGEAAGVGDVRRPAAQRARRPAAATATRQPLASRPLRLEVRISADHWEGDIHISERWGTEFGMERPGSVHFRYTQTGAGPSSVTCQVFRGVPPAGSAQPLVAKALGAPPGTDKVQEFDVDLTGHLASAPDGKDYYARLVGPNSSGGTSVWSRNVKLSYRPQEVTQFDHPALARVSGTLNAEGKPLIWQQTPMAVVADVFRVEGNDLEDASGDTVVQFLKDGQVVREMRPLANLTQRLPSGETSLGVRAHGSLAADRYQVRVKTGLGLSNQLPLFVCGKEDADSQYVGYVSNEEDRFVDYVSGFRGEFGAAWHETQYYWGEARFLGVDHLTFADSADLAYIAGHGAPSKIVMSSGQACWLPDVALGSYSTLDRKGDLEYIVFHSCSVLALTDGWRERWQHTAATRNDKRPFSGLHVAMGFRTTHHNGAGAGAWAADEFAENLKDGYSVRESWYEAAEDARFLAGYEDNRPAVFYLRPHRDEPMSQHNSPDYRYGDAGYVLDAYYME